MKKWILVAPLNVMEILNLHGNERSFFALELNYNYDVQGYKYGNDFASITIDNRQAIVNAQKFLDEAKI
jgi:hypothetical protein